MIFLTNHLFVEYFMFSSILAVINNAAVNVPCKLSWIFKIVYCKEQQLYGTLTSLNTKRCFCASKFGNWVKQS